jgi:hypothetical protein
MSMKTIAVTAVSTGMLLTGLAAPASAAPTEHAIATATQPRAATSATAFACTGKNMKTGTIKYNGHTVNGWGGAFGCSGSGYYVTLELQWGRWDGWRPVKSWTGHITAGRFYNLYYDCHGTGTHTFRTVMYGLTLDGSTWAANSPGLRTTCYG